MDFSTTIKKLGIEQALTYVFREPEKNLRKLIDWADRFDRGEFAPQRRAVREAITNPRDPYYPLVRRLLTDVDADVLKTLAVNFFVNANLSGWPVQERCRQKYGCNVPWAILMDPTSACNLHCTGCWAAEYGNRLNLSLDEIDDIIRQGKELGVSMYIYTGGEPLMRKDDLIRLCERHPDCVFLCFTNATLIDEAFADEMRRVKNFVPAISLEGGEEATDGRRGRGVYQKVMRAVDLLRRKKLFYGISTCYTRANYESVTSEAFYDSLIAMGAFFVWYFHYMPVGNDAVPELLPTAAQRRGIYERIRPLTMSIVDMAIDANVVKRKGSWLTYKGETLAQGKDRLAEFLDKSPEMLAEIRKTVLDQAAEGLGFYTAPEKSDDEDSVGSGHGVDIDEEVIDLDVSDESMKDEPEKEGKR